MKYYKIFHYSLTPNLEIIDPAYYGKGVTYNKREMGINKSYFYITDKPEAIVKSPNKYELYLPEKWRYQIYDLIDDPLEIYDLVKTEYKKRNGYAPMEYELVLAVEQRLKELGYKGWSAQGYEQLPNVMTLFYKISTDKPYDATEVYDWSNNIIETNPFQTNTVNSFYNLRNANKSANIKETNLNIPKLSM